MFKSKDNLTLQLKSIGITNWNELTKYVQNLPYGRNENRKDLSLILTEQKGTCSSKHAFLKKIADLNELKDIKLYIGIYKMNVFNTPQIGNILSENEFDYKLDYIPEAHCYLKINRIEQDFTNPTVVGVSTNDSYNDFEKLRNYILEEIEIKPHQVNEFKVNYHQNFLRKWAENQNKINDSVINFDAIWKIRETCIANLTE